MLDGRLLPATITGALVWEQTPMKVEGLDDRPRRGGTVVDYDWRKAAVRVVTGTPVATEGKRKVQKVNTEWLPMEIMDPASVVEAKYRAHERVGLARKLFRVLADGGTTRSDWDETLARWANQLWDTEAGVRSNYFDCGGKVCAAFEVRCDACAADEEWDGGTPGIRLSSELFQ